MDRSLEDVISERQPRGPRNRRVPRRDDYPRDGIRKVLYPPSSLWRAQFPPCPGDWSDDATNNQPPVQVTGISMKWTHDRYEDSYNSRATRGRDTRTIDSYVPGEDRLSAPEGTAKIRVENLHYEIGAEDVKELFRRIGDVASCELLYDRQDRSRGIAYVTYFDERDARDAIREFDGANAYGQPIRLSLVPMGPSARGAKGGRDAPGRSLFERIGDGPRRLRSASPSSLDRRGTRPTPDHIDRYTPGESRRRSPAPRRGGGNNGGGGERGGGRRPGARREENGRGRGKDVSGRQMVGGRPRKTAEELDAEMADYWGPGGDKTENTNGKAAAEQPVSQVDGDVDMIE